MHTMLRNRKQNKPEFILYSEDAIEVTSQVCPVPVLPAQQEQKHSPTIHTAASCHRDDQSTSYENSRYSRERTGSSHESSDYDSIFSNSALCTMAMPPIDRVAMWTDLRILDKLQCSCSHTLPLRDDGSFINTSNRSFHSRSNENKSKTDITSKSALQHSTKPQQQALVEKRPKTNFRTSAPMIIHTQSSLSEIVPHCYKNPIQEERRRSTCQTKKTGDSELPSISYDYKSPLLEAATPTTDSPMKQIRRSKFDTNAAGKTLQYLPDQGNARTNDSLSVLLIDQRLHSRAYLHHHYSFRDDMSKSSHFSQSKIRYSYPYLEEEDTLYGGARSVVGRRRM